MIKASVRRLSSLVAVAAVAAGSVVVSSVPVAAQPGGFGDVAEGAFYSVPVSTLAEQGVFAGTGCDEGFCPDDRLDRKTMAVWIVRVLDGEDPPVVTQTRFNDVDAAGFYAPFVERMADLGVTGGCGDGSGFCPDATVTRWQMAVFLSRAYDLPAGPDPGFSDVPADVWYAPAVARLTASGITSGCGDGTGFCPADDTTRAQMATFLWRAENRADAASDEAVAAGGAHTCVIGSDDTIACWGGNQLSQTEAPQGTFKAVSAGGFHTCAIGSDDTIACWGDTRSAEGRESCEELGVVSCDWPGSGATDAPSGSFRAVAAGGTHTCAIGSDDTITCWGNNIDGRADAPQGSFKAVAAGGSHTCAIASDDTIACWGNNQLSQSEAPQGSFKAVAAGEYHTCAVGSDGTIACWGDTLSAEARERCERLRTPSCDWTGSGATDAPSGRFKAVAAGESHTCAVGSDGTIACWGDNARGQTDAPQGTFEAVAAGGSHTCAIGSDGTIACWGDNGSGQTDTPLVGANAFAVSQFHGCAIRSDGTIACWGENFYGQTDAPPGTFKTLAVGEFHTCAIGSDDTIACWGNRITCVDSVCSPDERFTSPSGTFKALDSGADYACAIGSDDTITCWGHTSYGQADAPPGTFKAVTAGRYHACAIRQRRHHRLLGGARPRAVRPAFRHLHSPRRREVLHSCATRSDGTYFCAGAGHTCAIATDGTITCWGDQLPRPDGRSPGQLQGRRRRWDTHVRDP